MKTINVTKMKEELSKRYHTSFVEQILRTVEEFEEFEEKTTLELSNDVVECLVVSCCKRGPITNEKYCPFCGKKILK